MQQTTIQFPEIGLSTRDGHKLRGYFAGLFGQDSDLFHNHSKDGKPINRYPLIQYKIAHGCPTIVGLNEGAKLLNERFLNIRELDIEGRMYSVNQKNIKSEQLVVGIEADLFEYEFINPWMGLNERNYPKYKQLNTEMERMKELNRILRGNILSFMKGIGHWVEEQILVKGDFVKDRTNFKGNQMNTFRGKFTTNVRLSNYIGLGKSVARGYGAIQRIS